MSHMKFCGLGGVKNIFPEKIQPRENFNCMHISKVTDKRHVSGGSKTRVIGL